VGERNVRILEIDLVTSALPSGKEFQGIKATVLMEEGHYNLVLRSKSYFQEIKH